FRFLTRWKFPPLVWKGSWSRKVTTLASGVSWPESRPASLFVNKKSFAGAFKDYTRGRSGWNYRKVIFSRFRWMLSMRRAWNSTGPRRENVGGPAGSKKAAQRCTEAIRTVGPTLREVERKVRTVRERH